MRRPFYILRDPDLIKEITITHFDHFMDHASIVHEKLDPVLSNTVIFLTGQKWKNMRSMMSPLFSTSKIRAASKVLVENAKDFADYFAEQVKDNKKIIIQTKDIFSRVTMNAITKSAFSMTADFLRKDSDNLVYELRTAMKIDIFTHPRMFLLNFFPKIYELLKMRLFNKKVVDFVDSISVDAMRYREEHNIVRTDILQVLIEAQKGNLRYDTAKEEEGFISTHSNYFKNNKNIANHQWTTDELKAQAFVFFFAGKLYFA